MGKNPSIFVHIIQFRLKSSFFAHETDYPKGDRLNLRGKRGTIAAERLGAGRSAEITHRRDGGRRSYADQKTNFSDDELRGFAVFCMVFYHGFYTMAYLLGLPWGEWLYPFSCPLNRGLPGLFIFIAGISSNLTHSNLVRGAKLFGVALLVTIATAIAVPQELIVFGILHFLSICMMAFGLLQRLRSSHGDPPPFHLWPVILCAVLLLLTWRVPSGYLQIPFLLRLSLPQAWYQPWLAPLGLPGAGFSSADYFPLIPWCFVFAAGTVVGRLARDGKFPAWTYPSRVPFFSFLGRHALLIYIVHQPVIYGAGLLVQWIGSQL